MTLDFVTFGPDEVRAVKNKTAPRCDIIAVMTSQTCGEPCWHARELVCRCSCGGKNHGCLLVPSGEQPLRASKIDGERYTLLSVGLRRDVMPEAERINDQQFKSVHLPELVIGSESKGSKYTSEDVSNAKAIGKRVWFSQYKYKWNETDAGAPCRVKYATKEQLAKWPELVAWKDSRESVCLAWMIETMPEKPSVAVIDKETGFPVGV